ncbi:MAG: 3-dehydroquinate synthase [Acidobacteria bacterium]|nr:3-dehydroquinate synthase [Acidobacteriota bacterium]NIM63684.1 3-dehydroquinate synthase [Acidobacteriota bacterium]NIO59287.1 3-dehydroquinate synthase [Acidobacteriota bacterium]NIQ30299.1 3-dehydroquinate synthase [Acidobacteriota bacterium]NIQ85242.1 3-dehydroquinate synthase [Acidobacteriota bacterium]
MKQFALRFPGSPPRTTRIHVGRRLFARIAADLAERPIAERYFVVSDSRVGALYAADLLQALARAGLRADRITFARGEAAKTPRTKQRIEDRLLALGAGRDCAILALGGGVTGDLAGFVAATWHRGVPFIQLPTTLLAMVDASIGGKTAINLERGKNLVGAIHQPHAVYADIATLDTLPDPIYRDGFAEIVKGGVIADAPLFRWLEANAKGLLARRGNLVTEAVVRSVRVKARIVRRDERESGRRAILNFGHTVAHALEIVSNYRMSHGCAVAIGMAVEARLAVAHAGLSEATATRIVATLQAFGLPTAIPRNVSLARLRAATHRDKKARAGRARYALPVALGRMSPGVRVTTTVDDRDVLAALRASRETG